MNRHSFYGPGNTSRQVGANVRSRNPLRGLPIAGRMQPDLAYERSIRFTMGVVVTLTGILLMLGATVTPHWVVHSGETRIIAGPLGVLALGCFVAAIVASVVDLVRVHGIYGKFFELGFALAAMLCSTLGLLTDGPVGVGPSFVAGAAGSVLVMFGAYARVSQRPAVFTTEGVPDGQRFVYADGRVTAIEYWAHGELVSSRPFEPQIAGR